MADENLPYLLRPQRLKWEGKISKTARFSAVFQRRILTSNLPIKFHGAVAADERPNDGPGESQDGQTNDRYTGLKIKHRDHDARKIENALNVEATAPVFEKKLQRFNNKLTG